jgi:hypothetical protein
MSAGVSSSPQRPQGAPLPSPALTVLAYEPGLLHLPWLWAVSRSGTIAVEEDEEGPSRVRESGDDGEVGVEKRSVVVWGVWAREGWGRVWTSSRGRSRRAWLTKARRTASRRRPGLGRVCSGRRSS